MTYDYDLLVIGAGSGGLRAANAAAKLGKRVAVVESKDIGGTCVNRGCVPKKMLVVASRVAAECRNAHAYGWSVGAPMLDWPRLRDAVEAERLRISGVQLKTLRENDVTVLRGEARLVDAHTVAIVDPSTAEPSQVSAEHIVIATGGRPRREAPVPGIEHASVSDDMFRLASFPERLVVLGGGYIAVEFASMFAGFGSRVTLLARDAEILPGFDAEIAAHLREALVADGIDVRTQVKDIRIERFGERRTVTLASGEVLEADVVLAAIGRVPNTESLGLEAVGVKTGKKGEIVVDAQSCSSVANIHAVGDVTQRVSLTPVAIRESQVLVDHLFGKAVQKFSHELIPTAVFTTPEVIAIGLSEKDARKADRRVRVYSSRFKPLRQALTEDKQKVLIKLLVDDASDRVIGAHAVGPDVSEWVQFLDILLRGGATKADFDASVAVHPTMSEEFTTLREPVARI